MIWVIFRCEENSTGNCEDPRLHYFIFTNPYKPKKKKGLQEILYQPWTLKKKRNYSYFISVPFLISS